MSNVMKLPTAELSVRDALEVALEAEANGELSEVVIIARTPEDADGMSRILYYRSQELRRFADLLFLVELGKAKILENARG